MASRASSSFSEFRGKPLPSDPYDAGLTRRSWLIFGNYVSPVTLLVQGLLPVVAGSRDGYVRASRDRSRIIIRHGNGLIAGRDQREISKGVGPGIRRSELVKRWQGCCFVGGCEVYRAVHHRVAFACEHGGHGDAEWRASYDGRGRGDLKNRMRGPTAERP